MLQVCLLEIPKLITIVSRYIIKEVFILSIVQIQIIADRGIKVRATSPNSLQNRPQHNYNQ